MAVTKTHPIKSTLKAAIDYAAPPFPSRGSPAPCAHLHTPGPPYYPHTLPHYGSMFFYCPAFPYSLLINFVTILNKGRFVLPVTAACSLFFGILFIFGTRTPLLTGRKRNARGKSPTAKKPETAIGFSRRASHFRISFPPCQEQALTGGWFLPYAACPSGSAFPKQPFQSIRKQPEGIYKSIPILWSSWPQVSCTTPFSAHPPPYISCCTSCW